MASCCGRRHDGAEERGNRLTSFGASNTPGWTLMTIRGGGDPGQNTVIEPFVRMGPLPRSLAAEAHGCFMVRTSNRSYRIQGCGARFARTGGLPSDRFAVCPRCLVGVRSLALCVKLLQLVT